MSGVRLPVVLDCVAGMFTVAHRTGLEPARRARRHGQPGPLDRGRAGRGLPRRLRGARAARRHTPRPGAAAGPRRRGRRRPDAGGDGPRAAGTPSWCGRAGRRGVRGPRPAGSPSSQRSRACTRSRRRSPRPTGRGSASSTKPSRRPGPPPPCRSRSSGRAQLGRPRHRRGPRAACSTWPTRARRTQAGRGVRPGRPVLADRRRDEAAMRYRELARAQQDAVRRFCELRTQPTASA